jgi:hypothetical protein
MIQEKKKEEEKPALLKDAPVPVINGSDRSIVRLSEDQMRNLAAHFADSSQHEMY